MTTSIKQSSEMVGKTNSTYLLSSYDYTVTKLYKLELTVTGIIMQSLKSNSKFQLLRMDGPTLIIAFNSYFSHPIINGFPRI